MQENEKFIYIQKSLVYQSFTWNKKWTKDSGGGMGVVGSTLHQGKIWAWLVS